MIETLSESFTPQKRFKWYQTNQLLQSVGRSASTLNLEATDLVYIGGVAQFYRCYDALGSVSVPTFRGTHDLDVLSFVPGTIQRIVDFMAGKPESGIAGYSIYWSSSVKDKKSLRIQYAQSNDPQLTSQQPYFEVDVYEATNGGGIHYNNRVMTRQRIIMDAPEVLGLPKHRGIVAVPSLRDSLLIKMDVIDFSESGLRCQDHFDILTILKVGDELGIRFEDLVHSVVDDCQMREAQVPRLHHDKSPKLHKHLIEGINRGLVNRMKELVNVLSSPYSSCAYALHHPLLPQAKRIEEVLGGVKKVASRAGVVV